MKANQPLPAPTMDPLRELEELEKKLRLTPERFPYLRQRYQAKIDKLLLRPNIASIRSKKAIPEVSDTLPLPKNIREQVVKKPHNTAKQENKAPLPPVVAAKIEPTPYERQLMDSLAIERLEDLIELLNLPPDPELDKKMRPPDTSESERWDEFLEDEWAREQDTRRTKVEQPRLVREPIERATGANDVFRSNKVADQRAMFLFAVSVIILWALITHDATRSWFYGSTGWLFKDLLSFASVAGLTASAAMMFTVLYPTKNEPDITITLPKKYRTLRHGFQIWAIAAVLALIYFILATKAHAPIRRY